MKRAIPTIGIVALVLLSVLGCRSTTGQSLGTNIDNTTTTANVKTRLAADRLQSLTWVGVDTRAGTVYLTGNAPSEAQKQRAEEIARSVKGVQHVVNNIQVHGIDSTASGRSAPPAASPATSAAVGAAPVTVTGEVASVDRNAGHLMLRTAQGDMLVRMPASTLNAIQPGDRVRLEVTPRSQ